MAAEAAVCKNASLQDQTDKAAKEKAGVAGAQEDQRSTNQTNRQFYLSERYAFRSNHSLISVADPDLLLEEG